MINAKGETRPMVDSAAKYYNLYGAPEFRKVCKRREEYYGHAGDYVKNAYDPRFNPAAEYDEGRAHKVQKTSTSCSAWR